MHQRQLDKLRQSAQASLMSNAKWRKLFEAAAQMQPKLGGVEWQLLGNDSTVIAELDVADALVADNSRFDDCLPFPCMELRDIDWIFVPKQFADPRSDAKRPLPAKDNDVAGFIALLAQMGQFPLQQNAQGVTIFGYQW
ncbi:hypothetical protein L9G74_01610 [Shewanella sp. C32]|uniref:Uncharacterized protein n=1 Tax=Shewanella electrica TaxID=515560 RepID=A0ABT2FFQ1_9GAMM|nr:hypothetical protein [Shewanella electrica]MCH1925300.1 hypothetical protein [Shewanella electrica]MCS4555125.1 hypothetical protein [Shewanella electrica]